jgi:transcription elongation GreA/GreB family factor
MATRKKKPAIPSKTELRDALARVVEADLATAERAQRAAHEGATDEEAKPENDKDTRALEQSYLARGQAQRVEELHAALAQVRSMPLRDLDDEAPIALGALVTALVDDEDRSYFLAPGGGGTELEGGVQVVTPSSPLGRALLGRRVGDESELRAAGRVRTIEIVRVR